jgi:glycine/D-amino acid oxidase-like deaminating enzyme
LDSLFGGDPFVPDDSAISTLQLNGIAHLVRHPFEGVLHPGKLIAQLLKKVHAAGIQLINGIDVEQLITGDTHVRIVVKESYELKARYVIVATNAFAGKLIPGLPLTPARNQVYLTQPVRGLQIRGCFHYDHGFIYFREVDGRILIGGARNLNFEEENTSEFGLTEIVRQRLSDFVRHHILPDKDFRFEFAWSGIIGIGNEKGPIIRMVDERVAVTVRLSGIGIAIGSLVGAQGAQMILDRI